MSADSQRRNLRYIFINFSRQHTEFNITFTLEGSLGKKISQFIFHEALKLQTFNIYYRKPKFSVSLSELILCIHPKNYIISRPP